MNDKTKEYWPVFKVLMSSDEYETEEFLYHSLEEARQGFERLCKDAEEAFEDDGIEREINLVLDTVYITGKEEENKDETDTEEG